MFSSQSTSNVNRRQSSGMHSRPSQYRSGVSGHSSVGFYGRRISMTSPDSPEEDTCTWHPGECIPQSEQRESQPDIFSLILQMKTSISSKIEQVQSSLDILSGRVEKLEEVSAERSHLNQTPGSSSSSPSSSLR